MADEEALAVRIESRKLMLQALLGLVLFFGVVGLLTKYFRGELKTFSVWFVDQLGYGGMFLGTLCADGFHIPLPPQLYMYTGIATGRPHWITFTVIYLASCVAANIGYRVAGRLAHRPFLAKRIERTHVRVEKLYRRMGSLGIALVTMSPLPFSMLCWASGMYKLPRKYFIVILLIRCPRLLLFYLLIRIGIQL